MSRRRDMTPTLERKDGQIETMARNLAKAQERERALKNKLRDMQRSHLSITETLTEQLAAAQDNAKRSEAYWRDRCLKTEEAQRPLWQRLREWFAHITD